MHPSRHVSVAEEDDRSGDPPADPAGPPPVLTEKFPVLHFGRTPEYPDLSGWDFRVFGEVESPFTLRWAGVPGAPDRAGHAGHPLCDPLVQARHDLGGRAVHAPRGGRAAELKPTARFVIFHAESGYNPRTCRSRVAMQPDCLLAWSFAGEPLEERSAAIPCAPSSRGSTSGRAPSGCAGSSSPRRTRLGFWERNGYNNSADPWKEEAVRRPF